MAPSVGLEPTWTSRPTLRFLVGAATIAVRWHMAQDGGHAPQLAPTSQSDFKSVPARLSGSSCI